MKAILMASPNRAGIQAGKLASVERDPQERGYIDIVECYDDSGKLIRREVRKK
jgi:hypothetical protein